MKFEQFTLAIQYIKDLYSDWGVDTRNERVVKAWYGQLKNIESTIFNQLVKWYIKNKPYPPRSPVDLTNCYKEIFTAQYPTKEELEMEIEHWSSKYDWTDNGFREAMRNAPYYIWDLNRGKGLSYYQFQQLIGNNWKDEIEALATTISNNFQEEIKNKCGGFVLGDIPLPLLPNGELITREEELHGVKTEESKELYNGIKELGREFLLDE